MILKFKRELIFSLLWHSLGTTLRKRKYQRKNCFKYTFPTDITWVDFPRNQRNLRGENNLGFFIVRPLIGRYCNRTPFSFLGGQTPGVKSRSGLRKVLLATLLILVLGGSAPAVAETESEPAPDPIDIMIEEANLLTIRASLKREGKVFEEAQRTYEQAIELYQEADAYHGLGTVYVEFASMERWRNRFDSAHQMLNLAIEAYSKIQDESGLAYAYIELGNLEHRLQDWKSAEAAYDQALQLYIRVEDHRGQGNVLLSLGRTFLRRKNPEKIQETYLKAQMAYQKAQDKRGEASVLNALGSLKKFMGDTEQARSYYEQAIALNHEVASALPELEPEEKNKPSNKLRRMFREQRKLYDQIKDQQVKRTSIIGLAGLYPLRYPFLLPEDAGLAAARFQDNVATIKGPPFFYLI